MQPIWRRATLRQSLNRLFSASSSACTSTTPNTVLRLIVSTACATALPAPPIASCPPSAASTMLSSIDMRIGSLPTSSCCSWIEPTMLCSIRTRALSCCSSRLGSAGRSGSQSQSIPQPGTSVQWRISNSAAQLGVFSPSADGSRGADTCSGRPVTITPSSANRLPISSSIVSASGKSVCQSIRRITGRTPFAARRVSVCPGRSRMCSGSTHTPLLISSITACAGASSRHWRRASAIRGIACGASACASPTRYSVKSSAGRSIGRRYSPPPMSAEKP